MQFYFLKLMMILHPANLGGPMVGCCNTEIGVLELRPKLLRFHMPGLVTHT
jgi:hypothetical protein